MAKKYAYEHFDVEYVEGPDGNMVRTVISPVKTMELAGGTLAFMEVFLKDEDPYIIVFGWMVESTLRKDGIQRTEVRTIDERFRESCEITVGRRLRRPAYAW